MLMSLSNIHGSATDLQWVTSAPLAPCYLEPTLYEGRSEDRATNNTWFTGGLPTPPGTKAMAGVSLGNSFATYATHAFTHNSRQPFQDVSNGPSTQYRPAPAAQVGTKYCLNTRTNSAHGYHAMSTDKINANAIASHLQIPESVNKSKGSLAEFAAEVRLQVWNGVHDGTDSSRSLAYSGSRVRQRCSMRKPFPRMPTSIEALLWTPYLRLDFENGSRPSSARHKWPRMSSYSLSCSFIG